MDARRSASRDSASCPAGELVVPGRVGCMVLAAGAGSRFGGAKQLATLADRPLLEHVLETAAAAPVDRAVLVLGARAEQILERVELRGVVPVICERWRMGMSEALKSGIAALSDLDAAVILLGDQPLIPATAVARTIAARRGGRVAVRATYGGRAGHPVVLERRLFPSIAGLRGDVGARSLLAGSNVTLVPCEDIAEAIDVDVPAELRRAEGALSE